MLKVNWDVKSDKIKESVLQKIEEAFLDFITKELKLNKYITLHIILCSDDKILELNTDYRKKAKLTDVLSFPIFENLRGEPEAIKLFEEVELGDIYICESVCMSQAEKFGLNFYEEFVQLSIHGFLHLLGYDHEVSEKEDKLMQLNEKKIAEIYKAK